MNVLVTGATGFVGGHLVDALLARGHTVSALVRNPSKGQDLARRGVIIIAGDLDHAEGLAKACQGQAIVFHLAGLVAARNQTEFDAVNRDGTARLVDAAGRVGAARLVLVSSLAAGGPTTPGHPLAGPEVPRPVTQYGRSKLAGEDMVRASALDWTIIRPPAVYGPGDREMLRVFKAAAFGIAPVFGDGSQQLSLIYGPDLAEALVAAGTSAATSRGTFYACHPEAVSSRRLVELAGSAAGTRVRVIGIPEPAGRAILWVTDRAARLAGRATILSYDKAAEFFAPAWLADPSPFMQATGWAPNHPFEAGARLTVEWYRHHGWL